MFVLGRSKNASSRALESEPNPHLKFCLILLFVAVAAYAPVVLINQPMWDDWVLRFRSEQGTLQALYRDMGLHELFWLLKPFASIPPSIDITVVLLLYAAIGPLVYTIIRQATPWSPTDAFWVSLLTVLAPLNQARFALATMSYAFSSFAFALAIVLLLRDLTRPAIVARLSVALCLVVAFTTNSFLVLAWLMPFIVAVMAWRNSSLSSTYGKVLEAIRATLGRGELLLLPPLYWLAKKFQPTHGLYAQYNQFKVSLPTALEQSVGVLADQFWDFAILFPPSTDILELSIVAAIVIAVVALAVMRWKLPLGRAHARTATVDLLALGIGLVLVASALIPYLLVGKPPRFTGLWETRHQTTLMLFSGFVLYALLRLILPRRLLAATAAALATFFFFIDMSVSHRLLRDSFEATEITHQLRAQPSPPGTMMLVVEEDRNYRALGRFFAFYELSYMVSPESSQGTRLVISSREVRDPSTDAYATGKTPGTISKLIELCERYRSNPQYGFGNFVSNGRFETVRLVSNRQPPRLFETISEGVKTLVAGEGYAMSTAMVRIEREASKVDATCRSPCCPGS